MSSRELFWASGSLATGSVYNAMALFALYFMTSELGIAAGTAGAILFVTKLYDAVTDPAMGAISDRTHHRWGSRRPYLLVGAILLGLSFAAFFNLPLLSGWQQIGLVVLSLLVYSTGYTIFAVPYLAMPPDLAPGYDDRTRLMSMRLVFLILGVMIGSAFGPTIVQWGGEGRSGYALLGWVLGGLAIVAGLAAFVGTRGVASPPPVERKGHALATAVHDLVSVFKQSPFRLLTLIKLLQLAVLALALACTPYFFSYVLERSTGEITKYLLTFSLTGLVSIPAWRLLIGRVGKREVYIGSIIAYALGLASWYFWTPSESEVWFYGRAVFLGVIGNGTLLCALSLLPDTMEHDRLVSGLNREGVMSGVFTTVEKIAGAFGPLIVGVMLQMMGFISGSSAEQPDSALLAIRLCVSIVPAILCLLAVPLLLAYRLGPVELAALRSASQNTNETSPA